MFVLIAYAAEQSSEAVASGGIGAIGIDLRSLILQIVNFAILLLLLKKFAYKPILDVLEARRLKIDESIKNARDIEATKLALDKKKEAILKETYAKAQTILEQSKKQAAEIIADTEKTAAVRDKQLLSVSQAKIEQEAKKVREELLNETATFVSLATEKVLNHKLTEHTDAALIRDAIQATIANSGNV